MRPRREPEGEATLDSEPCPYQALSVLLATRNSDKVSILCRLLLHFAPFQMDFCTPDSERCSLTTIETGTVIERACAKSESHLRCCGRGKNIIVGSDDGFRIPDLFGERILCNSQWVTKMILGGGITHNTRVLLIRSFWIIDLGLRASLAARNDYHCVTEIPFRFIGDHGPAGVASARSVAYPLSNVLGRLNADKPVSAEPTEVTDAYYAEHSAQLSAVMAQLTKSHSLG